MNIHEIFVDTDLSRPDVVDLIDANGLRVRLKGDTGRRVLVEFKRYQVFRKRDESFAGKTIELLVDAIKPKRGFHWLYELHHSEFLSWFDEETLGVVAGPELRHFMMVTADDIIDVIATELPAVSIDD